MSKLGSMAMAAILSAALSAASPALARGGGRSGHDGGFHDGGGFHHGFHDHDGFRGGFFFGGIGGLYYPYLDYPYYAYPYAYPYPYVAPYAPAAAPATPANDLWYFCQPAKAYYPYVSSCPVPWQQVPAQPQ
jgi:hypothetical protein